jgi:hypothetical protein
MCSIGRVHATVFTNYSGPMNYANTIQQQQHKSNNNTIFDRTDYETCYKTNIKHYSKVVNTVAYNKISSHF